MDDNGREANEIAARQDAIPIELSFECGRTDIPLGHLRTLTTGMILDLRASPEELIEIRANGQPVGRGTLVDIEGKIGVRIVRIFGHG